MFRCAITGTGAYVPEKILTNFDLETMVDTSNEWIIQRTGIRERRIAAPDEATSDMAIKAARMALEHAEEDAEAMDAIILCTCTPDTYCPSCAVYVQRGLGAKNSAAFDISAACTGFIYGVSIASSMIAGGAYKKVLVAGAETLSRIVDYQDRNTCILFGDGAGAAVLSRTEDEVPGVLDSALFADGSASDLIEMPAGGARAPASHETVEARQHFLRMQGREVFKFATKTMVDLIRRALERNNLTVEDLNLVVPHQVNYRIIEAALRKIAIPEDRIYLNLDRYGNTSAASVPLGLHEAVQDNRVKKGDLILLLAFGAGMTWGYNLIRW